jgi:DNA polymerase-3 subunit beta
LELSVLQENLKVALATVSHAVVGKSPLAVLSNVLLTADADGLHVVATDLEIGMRRTVGAKVEVHGSTTLPAKLLTDVIGGLPNDKVTLTLNTDTQTVKVECARSTSNINGITAEDYPNLPEMANQKGCVTLPAPALKRAIEQVAVAAANDESRPVLTGVLVRLNGDCMTLAAADGFRLAVKKIALEQAHEAAEVIIPARALDNLARVLGDGDVELAWNAFTLQATTDTAVLYSRLIDGTFPDFERIIPQKHTTRSILDVKAFQRALKLATLFAQQSQNIVKITTEPGSDEPGKLVLSANAAEVGDNTGEIEGMVHGDGGQVALNCKFLADALAAMGTTQVAFEQQTAQNPGVLKPVGEDDYVHIVMPMTIR